MLCRVALVRTDVSEEHITSIIRVKRIALSSVLQLRVIAKIVLSSLILFTLMMEAICSSETSILTRAKRHNIPEYGILHSHRRKNLKSYIIEWI
jgi:hypothetical protein